MIDSDRRTYHHSSIGHLDQLATQSKERELRETEVKETERSKRERAQRD